jgi:thiol-disulfide isomerase/thioredoxin
VASVKMDGTPYRLSDSRGKVVLLFFWASWCPYSRAALPGVQAIQNRYANRADFQIVGVSLDSSGEMLRAAVQSHDIRWVNVFENGMSWNGPFAKAYEIRAIPSLWVIGKDSKVTGADVSLPAAEDILSVLLENRHREGTPQGASAPTSGPPWDGACSALPAS